MKDIFNKINNFHIALILATIVILTHIDIIFAPPYQYFSSFDLKDLNYYINVRQYGFYCLMSGYFPLWTTKLFCGIPFFANSETSIFYLPNIIFLFLPVSKAFNLSFVLHFFILSFNVFLWIDNKIKDKLISLIAATVAVFFSNFYLHFYAAHLSNIITIVWFPLLLYFYDKVFEKKAYIYVLPVSFIISLQIFAGHFQYIYYTALVSFLYILFFCRNKKTFSVYVFSYITALFLTAVQFLPSLSFYFEGARKTGALAHFSLYSQPLYLITLVFPKAISFMNNWFWETSNYIGLITFLVLITAIFHIRNKFVIKNVCMVLIIYLLSFKTFSVFAGYFIPFFDMFRSPIKLNFFVNILLLPIFAYGIKYLLSEQTKINRIFLISLIGISAYMSFKNNIAINSSNSSVNITGQFSMLLSGILIFIFSILSFFKKYRISKIFLVLILILEPILIMKSYSKPFIFNDKNRYEYVQQENFNEQTRFFSNNNYNLNCDAENLSGSVPDALSNYIRFMKYLERPFNASNILGLLRCRYIVDDSTGKVEQTNIKMLNRINVFYDYKLQTVKGEIYETLSDMNFDIFSTVILEKEPQYEIKGKGEYNLKIIYFDENSIEFECDTTKPAIILYTDNYSKDWYAYNIENPKEKYEIICADYIYKAISVDKGKHKIRFEYKPVLFVIGKYISMFAWFIFAFFCLIVYVKKRKYLYMKRK